MLYHILFIVTAAIIILVPAVPLIICLSCFHRNAKKKSRGLAVLLTVIFTVIAVIPAGVLGGFFISLEIKNDRAHNEALTQKEKLIQFVTENEENFNAVAEYEASFEYPNCEYYFTEGHDTEHLNSELGIDVDHMYLSRLAVNPETHKVIAVCWDYYINDYYNIVVAYPVDGYDISDPYEHICGNLYILVTREDHN